MRCLVTGGAGFIGKATANALAELDHEVIVIDDLSSGNTQGLHPKIQFIEGDVRNQSLFPKKLDAIYHFAARVNVRAAMESPTETLSVNILGTSKLIEHAQVHRVQHFIYASSGSTIYGNHNKPCSVRTNEDPQCPYSLSKYTGEQLLVQYARFNCSPFTILRYSNVYGPGQETCGDVGVISVFNQRAQEGLPLVVYGGGQTRDFIHIYDVVAANIAALNARGIYNVSTGNDTSVTQLASYFSEAYGVNIIWEDSPWGEVQKSCLIPSKIKGWKPRISLEEGLATLSP